MAEFIGAKEQIAKFGDKISVNYGSIPFEVIMDGDNKKVAFNQDGEYLVSVFDGKVTVTTLKHSQ